jgi:hypothetical protein
MQCKDTALIYAAIGHLKVVQLLLQHGARVNHQNKVRVRVRVMRCVCADEEFLLDGTVCQGFGFMHCDTMNDCGECVGLWLRFERVALVFGLALMLG